MSQDDLQTYFLNKLLPHGQVEPRKMFGCVGYFQNGVIFALLIDGELYFRVDDKTEGDFEAYGTRQFTYEARGKEVLMPYFVVPREVLEKSAMMAIWMERAIQASLRNLAKKAKRKRKISRELS